MADRWNAAHKALIDARTAKTKNLSDWEEEVKRDSEKLARTMKNRDAVKRGVEEIEDAILAGHYEPMDNFDIWGAKDPHYENANATA